MFGRKVRFHLFGKDIRGMRRTKSSSLKQKRANKHLRGIKKYTLSNEQSNEQKSFDYVSTSDMLFAINVRYLCFYFASFSANQSLFGLYCICNSKFS